MSTFRDCPLGRSQHFTFSRSRRNLLQGIASVILPIISRPQAVTPFGLCRPKFSIGDKVRTFWVNEFQEKRSENGQVVGVCWHPKKRHWEYLVVWDSSSRFDEELTDAEGLELHYA
jgi:hypothetical protein